MTRDQAAAFMRRYIDAWEQTQIPALLDCYADEIEVTSPMFHTITGRIQLEKSWNDLFRAFSHWQITIDDIIVEDDRGVLVLTSHATHAGEIFGVAASGRRFETRAAFIFTFAHDCIVKEARIYDFTGLLVQLGILRAKAAI